jgi:hypothetical protein
VPWYVFGAQAVVLWGRPRFSADVDVTVWLAFEETGAFVEAMEGAGFELRVRDRDEFVRRTRVLPFVHLASRIPLDVVLAGPGLEEVFLRRAIRSDLSGVSVPYMSPEDLVISKILAGRPKDTEDVRGILLTRAGSLDVGWIRQALGLLEEALSQSDLMPRFEAELAAAAALSSFRSRPVDDMPA